MGRSWIRSAVGLFFEYDTPRIVHIRSKKVGALNRFLQLCIIGYIIGYVIVFEKGYQDFDSVQSAVTIKLKGVAFTNTSDPNVGARIWDVTDYVVPPQENDAFFVTTNVIVTPNQTQGECPEDPNIEDACCEKTGICTPGEAVEAGNGVKTGECVDPVLPIKPGNPNCTRVCKIYAWCPVENNISPKPPLLMASQNFTVYIKNNIEFPKFNIKRRNIPDSADDKYLQTCRYMTDKYCPIFQLGTIIAGAGADYEEVAAQGAVVQVVIRWDCNLDFSKNDCLPVYSFRRLDASDDFNTKVSPGFNFRYANYYEVGGVPARTMIKAYGIRFIVSVEGQGGKFSFVPLILKLGSCLALLSIATILSDIVVLYCLKARKFFWDKKYLNVKGDDAYEVLDEDRSDVGKRPSQGDISTASMDAARRGDQ